jgi:response regulator of citrate/malate metabolism
MILTDWHHLFGMTLTDYFSGTSYKVELEKELSLKKQRLDVVIIDEQDGKPPDELPDGLDNLISHNLQ